MKTKTVLCYGDSITWGYNPTNQEKMHPDERWSGVLRNRLGENYTVIEEGLNGRTTVWDDPLNGGYKNGLKYLIPCLSSHRPIDLCILLLGTNDLKKRFSLSALEIAGGMSLLVKTVLTSQTGPEETAPKLLIMAPPYITNLSGFEEEFEEARGKARKLPDYYAQIARDYNCEFLDTSKIIVASEIDGVHPDIGEHFKLANAVHERVKKII